MALVQKKMDRKRLITLAAILVVFFGITLYLVFTNYLSGGSGTVTDLPTDFQTPTDRDLPIFTDLGKDVLQDPRIEGLELHGSFPITPGKMGRTNPFVETITLTTE
ncbi:hypothetical protein KKG41_04965 [Patescibacteria group bacterium]|nr:hypothetical protein [Patescibacteria group bacterium]MBU1890523.1 hypothetical protein [Patescibacteria group bacterium]